MFKIVIVGGPAEKYIVRCLKSVLSQKVQDFQACVVLDPVGDKTYDNAKSFESEKIKIIQNTNRLYALPNIIRSINELNCSDDDIICTVDADDWLKDENSLLKVKQRYDNNPDLLVTYGSWQSYPDPNAITNNRPHTEEDFKKGIRRVAFRATHLRTFKYKVWKHIKEKDLKDDHGKFFETAWDLSFMWPLLEQAGYNRSAYIPDILYVYNQEHPFNDSKMRLREQMFYTDFIAARPPYQYREVF